MHLSDGRRRLDFTVLGYEFPGAKEHYDANWLAIRCVVESEDGGWSFEDACMLTWEVERLAAWFETLGSGSATVIPKAGDNWGGRMRSPFPVEEGTGFMEPLIDFSLIGGDMNAVEIGVQFSHEARPPWKTPEDDGWDREFVLPLAVKRTALAAAARSLREEIQRFPFRGGLP